MITKEARWFIAAFCSVSLLACASEPPAPASAGKTETVTAKVVAVDTDKRLLMLQGPEDVVPIEVPESVRNLESVKVGDQLAVTYYTGVAAVFAEQTRDGNSTENKDVTVTRGAVNTPAGVPP
ncbi:MAG: hypothetical protein ABW110_25050, partial [Steroidobacteraceae bacterium]